MFILKLCVLTIFLFYLSYLDIHTRTIPNKIIFIFISISFIFIPFESNWITYVIGLFVPSTIFLIISIIGGHFIGSGDIKIIICLGGFLGTYQTLVVIFLACIICLFYGILLKLFYKLDRSLPFCPYIFISLMIIVFYRFYIVNTVNNINLL